MAETVTIPRAEYEELRRKADWIDRRIKSGDLTPEQLARLRRGPVDG